MGFIERHRNVFRFELRTTIDSQISAVGKPMCPQRVSTFRHGHVFLAHARAIMCMTVNDSMLSVVLSAVSCMEPESNVQAFCFFMFWALGVRLRLLAGLQYVVGGS